jgi:prephenate dehydratase
MNEKVAIQGTETSFHDVAAREYFGSSIDLVECRTFRQQCQELVAGGADYALMAIENSLAGSILPNYGLLEEFPIAIAGEVYIRIQQHLLALPGQTLPDITSVRSHPIALQQCSEFLEANSQIRSIESYDTAASAKEIAGNQLKGIAAIAGRLAAERFGLVILAESIENNRANYTRFLILEKGNGKQSSEFPNKASLTFHVRNQVGALAEVLNIFREYSLNLGLIQSTPIVGRPEEYAFHVDINFQNQTDFLAALKKVGKVTTKLKILGKYQAGAKPGSYNKK